jgi:hypothetical protein
MSILVNLTALYKSIEKSIQTLITAYKVYKFIRSKISKVKFLGLSNSLNNNGFSSIEDINSLLLNSSNNRSILVYQYIYAAKFLNNVKITRDNRIKLSFTIDLGFNININDDEFYLADVQFTEDTKDKILEYIKYWFTTRGEYCFIRTVKNSEDNIYSVYVFDVFFKSCLNKEIEELFFESNVPYEI